MKRKGLILIFIFLVLGGLAFVYYPDYEVEDGLDAKDQRIAGEVLTVPSPVAEVAVRLEAEDDPNPYIQKALQAYDDYLQQALKKNLTPGVAVAILRDSTIIYLKGFGVRSVGTNDSININTVFRVGSVSKSITASLAAKLVDDHFLDWDDSVTKFLPNFELKSLDYTRQLTVRHVLSHTMGLPYHAYTIMIEERTPLDTLLNHLKDLDLHSAPGKMYSYQNVGFSLIQKVVETNGSSFEDILKEKLFNPLQMRDASASFQGIMSKGNVAMPHHFTKRGWQPTNISDTYYNSVPAGGINCSISDMALWLRNLNSTESNFWSEESRDEMFKPLIRATARNRSFWIWQRPKASYYGLGWRVITFPNDTLYYHGGYVNGYRSEVAIHPKSKMAIAVLTNAAGNFADQSIPQFFKTIKAYQDSAQRWEDDYRHTFARKN